VLRFYHNNESEVIEMATKIQRVYGRGRWDERKAWLIGLAIVVIGVFLVVRHNKRKQQQQLAY
jgi:hypothetical protein